MFSFVQAFVCSFQTMGIFLFCFVLFTHFLVLMFILVFWHFFFWLILVGILFGAFLYAFILLFFFTLLLFHDLSVQHFFFPEHVIHIKCFNFSIMKKQPTNVQHAQKQCFKSIPGSTSCWLKECLGCEELECRQWGSHIWSLLCLMYLVAI